jgi:hypothetical protein
MTGKQHKIMQLSIVAAAWADQCVASEPIERIVVLLFHPINVAIDVASTYHSLWCSCSTNQFTAPAADASQASAQFTMLLTRLFPKSQCC